jgi:cell division protein FtsI/penicillin-binding protein 2
MLHATRSTTGACPAAWTTTPRRLAVVAAVVLLLGGCTAKGAPPTPDRGGDHPGRAAAELAAGLAAKDVTKVEFAGAVSADVNDQFAPLVAGMGPVKPTVTVVGVETQAGTATAVLKYSWTFAGVPQAWTYESSADLVNESGRWKTSWQPSIVAADLDGSNRLTQRRLYPERGELRGVDENAIVEKRAVFRIGIDKTVVSGSQAATSAARLAALVNIDASAYQAKVASAGAEAFVEAIVIRAGSEDRPSGQAVAAIPGARSLQDQLMLAPTADFARPIIGAVGQASKEIVEASKGAVVAGDQVGLSGLQRRYDVQLRGTPGVRVQLVASKASTPGASPSSDTSPSSSGSPSPSSSATPPGKEPVTVFEAKPAAGRPLDTTLNVLLQQRAETILAGLTPASAIVAIKPSTGEVLVAANGRGTKGISAATVGQYPPGSTFKIATSLALLRAGLQPSSEVTCPTTVNVDGRSFKNYDDYPASQRGTITLRTAVAQSCNTAFIGQRDKVSGNQLAEAAATLGLGTDYDVGFASFFGSVPKDKTETGRAAAMIGQGKVQASPLAMAAVAASVSAGRTVVPHLVKDTVAKSKAKPLTAGEARQLKEMMGAVVSEGSGRFLQSLGAPAVIAKTGTAEYGTKKLPDTHAWMIGAQGDLAVAVFVGDGESGSKTAGPLLQKFLRAAK